MSEKLNPLLDKLEKAKFTGELHLSFDAGQIQSARISHYLAYSQFKESLPIIEENAEAAGHCLHCQNHTRPAEDKR